MGEVVGQDELLRRCRQRKENGEKVVLVAGIFDLLHAGHVRLLEQARDYGNILVAAVLNDSSVRAGFPPQIAAGNARSLGVPRPVTPAAERTEILAALAAVDYAVEVDFGALPDLLTKLSPDVAVESAEPSSPALLRPLAGAAGVTLVRIPFEPGHSTSGIIERIVQLSGSE